MDKETFDALFEVIGHHNVYVSTGQRPQKPARLQILTTLYILGGSKTNHIARLLQISEGTIPNYVRQTVIALLSVDSDYLSFTIPGSARYQRVIDMHMEGFGLPNCLGSVDGTLVPLWRKPDAQGAAYYTRKAYYAINFTMIAGVNTEILWISIGRKFRHYTILINRYRHHPRQHCSQ
jgi:hypothetical protein